MINEIKKMYNKVLIRISLLLARGYITSVDDSGKTQKLQVNCLADETVSNIERFEQYGMAAYPIPNSEAFVAFLNGNRSQGIVLCVHNREYRPSYLSEGEVALYSYIDKTTNHRIHFTKDGYIKMYGSKYYISNNAEDLIDLMVQFCTAVEGITVATGIGVQPIINKATFTTLKTKLSDFKI